ncbi:MAG TPA: glycoside hydrolase family 5 protein [Burkholderiaceae bacterium]
MARHSLTKFPAPALLLAAAALLAGCAATPEAARPLATAAAPSSMAELTTQMTPGINLGNTMEALPNETAWGNPVPSQALMDGYRAAGFRSVRIPLAWRPYEDSRHQIDHKWMAHVREVVDQARRAGLYVMINTHWDGGWMNHPTYDHQAAIQAQLAAYWSQIATEFKDYDEHLLFAGSNEVGVENSVAPPTPEQAAVQNAFNQTFVDTVRAAGGRNATRYLVVQSFSTNIGHAIQFSTIPRDPVPGRLLMEVHYYDPFNFTINGKSTVWQWGKRATDRAASDPWADEPWVDKQFDSMKTHYVDHGVGVIVGEYGAYAKPEFPGSAPYIRDWARYVTGAIRRNGLVPMWWDTGALVDRRTGAQKDPELIQAIVGASR